MIKTKKAVARRFRKNKRGTTVKFARPGKGHLLTSKTTKRKRKLRRAGYLAGKDEKNVKRFLARV